MVYFLENPWYQNILVYLSDFLEYNKDVSKITQTNLQDLEGSSIFLLILS